MLFFSFSVANVSFIVDTSFYFCDDMFGELKWYITKCNDSAGIYSLTVIDSSRHFLTARASLVVIRRLKQNYCSCSF